MNVTPEAGSATDKAIAFLIVVLTLLLAGVVIGIIPGDNLIELIRLVKS